MNLIGYVDVEICHFYHGETSGRSQVQRQIMLLTQYPWLNRIVKDDEQGLLSWIDTKHYFYDIASKLHTVNNDVNNAARLFQKKLDYFKFFQEIEPTYNSKYRFGS